jgi:excisionase family DNA binding protein
MSKPQPEELITVKEAMARLGKSFSTVYTLVDNGTLKVQRVGKRRPMLILASSLPAAAAVRRGRKTVGKLGVVEERLVRRLRMSGKDALADELEKFLTKSQSKNST